jgi:hypothetical protein
MKKSGVFRYIRIVSFRTVSCWHPVALTGAVQLRADEISSCCHISKCTQTIRHDPSHEWQAGVGSLWLGTKARASMYVSADASYRGGGYVGVEALPRTLDSSLVRKSLV